MVNINIRFSNKTFYLLIGILAILAVSGIAYALNSGDHSVHGHTFNELPDCENGKVLKMSDGEWVCSSGDGGGSCAFCETCGGDYPTEKGRRYFQNSFAKWWGYGENCGGSYTEHEYIFNNNNGNNQLYSLCCN